jgi:plasmid stabilization system protein ParE
MMSPQIVAFHPKAIEEAKSAAKWYRERDAAVAEAFISELEHAVEMIAEAPKTWPRYAHGTRRFLLRRFPFAVIYREAEETIQVIAVPHTKRKPYYWKDR